MTGRIIPIHGDPHERIIALLPWFVSGRLDPAERAEVEAHLTSCPGCRAEERMERRLEAEVSALPLDVEHGWARMRARLAEPTPARRIGVGPRLAAAARRGDQSLRRSRAWLIGSVTLQAALMLMMLAVIWPAARPASPVASAYHALSAGPTSPANGSAAGNVLLMFRPETPERALRAALAAGQARLVDGPTAAGAYVVQVPAERRAVILAALRGRAEVTLAQPIDPGKP
jgi:anti-sigma factor RsiW